VKHHDSLAATADTWIEVSDGRLFAQLTGDGSPLLLIHGWAMDHRIFTRQVPALSQQMRVITFDRRGFGRSEAPPDLGRELDDIDRLLDVLSGEPVHLLGMSQGGRIALRYAITRPQRLRSLILQGAMVDGLKTVDTDNERIPIREFTEFMRRGNIEAIRQRWRRHPMMDIGNEDETNLELLDAMLQSYSGADLVDDELDHLIFKENVLGALVDLDVPTLILTGAGDTVARRRHATELAARIPGARELILENSGHLCNLTEPDVYNEAVLAFCRNPGAGRRDSVGRSDD